MKVAVKTNNNLQVFFQYDPDLVQKVKTLPGRRWNPDDKYWSVPYTPRTAKQLREWGFSLPTSQSKFKLSPDQDKLLPTKLFNFQKAGVTFLEEKNGRALIGDEQGLGKTAQALSWLQIHPKTRPAIIVCPASLKWNWAEEASIWLSDPGIIQVLNGKKPYLINGDLIILNYDILGAWTDLLAKMNPQVVIIDEVHMLKNPKALRTKAIKKLVRQIPHLICLSGTPIVNRPIEFFTCLNMLDRRLFPSRWRYAHRYCGARHNGFGWTFNGATHTEELHEIISENLMIRRLKKDVLSELPEKTRITLPLDIDNPDCCQAIQNETLQELKGQNKMHQLAKIERLKQACWDGKRKQCLEWIENFLDSGEKLIVFCTHKKVVKELKQKFGNKSVVVDGSVTGQDRQNAVKLFQNNDKIRLFIGNIKAAGIGLTLTAASAACFLELAWAPGDHLQAEDRPHRIGQKNAVTIYYLVAKNTIEEKIMRLLDKKARVLDQVLDGKTGADNNDSVFTELIKELEA